jgi:hypothetical protein
MFLDIKRCRPLIGSTNALPPCTRISLRLILTLPPQQRDKVLIFENAVRQETPCNNECIKENRCVWLISGKHITRLARHKMLLFHSPNRFHKLNYVG